MLLYICTHLQIALAENDDDIKLCFSIDEGASLLNETGYRKAVCSLKLSDRPAVLGALLDYHLMIKVKAEMDQFKEGLQTLGYLEVLQSNPSMWEEYFLDADVPLTAGMCSIHNNVCNIV